MSSSYSPPQRSYSPDPNPDKIPLNDNYPTACRKDTMFLSTIGPKDFPMRKFKKLDTSRDWSINLYNLDIEGSSPRRFGALNQKIDFTNKNDGIERSWPKQLHVGLNKPEYNLRNDDIEKSSPQCVEIKTTRHTNPLEPKYKLASTEDYPPEIPKFIRDQIDVKDIEGAQPTKKISLNILSDPLKKDDIQDSWPKKPYVRKKSDYQYIDYSDVYKDDYLQKIMEPSDKSKIRNPLDPIYYMGFINGDKETHGPIDGNKPCSFSKYHYDPAFNLRTDDILGTSVGSKNYINKFNGMNYIYTNQDILGTTTGSLKKGIVTKRNVNPLRPKYKYLGAEELKEMREKYKEFRKTGANTSVGGKRIDFLNKNSNNQSTSTLKSPLSDPNISNPLKPKISNTTYGKMKNIDFGILPYVDDTINFDKTKYNKPSPFYGYLHDQYIIPPLEKHKRKEILVNPNIKSFQETIREKANRNMPPTITSGMFPKQSYAQKLDDFMVKSNLKYVEDIKPVVVENKVENNNPVEGEGEQMTTT